MGEVTNRDIAGAFERIADLMDILGESPFRVNSYRRVARVFTETPGDVAAMAADGTVTDLPGVGKGSAEKIAEFVATGRIQALEDLLAKVPPGLPALLRLGGLGPKTLAKLWTQADVTDADSLTEAIDEGRLLAVDGIGAKKVEQIRQAMQFAAEAGDRMRLDAADAHATALLAAVAAIDGADAPVIAGSYRRGRDTVGDLDVLCRSAKGDRTGAIIRAFTAAEDLPIDKVLAAGDTKAGVRLADGVQVDLRVVPPDSYGAALQYFTGSKAHNVRLRELAVKRGLKLNEYGLFDGDRQLAGAVEDDIYKALGLAPIPPELREDRGELAAAAEGKLPKLLTLDDIRGDLHMHTTASDGTESIEAMIAACAHRGYRYLAITEHSKSQAQAHGLDADRLAAHRRSVAAAAAEAGGKGIRVYFSCEVDIFADGGLDFPDEVLATLDFVIGSAHSALSQKRPEATRRIIRAIESPFVRVIGHPSGRLINLRPGMELGIDEIVAAAAAHDVALEINAHPYRLDLRDTHVRAAVEAGAKLMINTDAHSIGDLDTMRFGVLTARRGWATAADVVNTLPPAKFDTWIKRIDG